MPEGTIPDPRMNPIGERAFGTVINDEDGHHYVYIKEDSTDEKTASRYFVGGTKVNVGAILPAFLVIPKTVTPAEYKDMKFVDGYPKDDPERFDALAAELEQGLGENFELVRGLGNKAVLFDIIEVTSISETIDQKIIRKLNKEAEKILKEQRKG